MQIKKRLNSKFKMTDFGQLFWLLGIQFECKNNTIKMNQSRYIEKILSKFGMADCKPHSTPCEMDITKISDKVDLIESKPSKTRFFPFNEGKTRLTLFKSIINQSLIFKKLQKPLKLEGFCDSNWCNLDDRKKKPKQILL